MNLDSVVSPQVLNKYLILVDVKSGRFKYQSGRAGDEAKKLKLNMIVVYALGSNSKKQSCSSTWAPS